MNVSLVSPIDHLRPQASIVAEVCGEKLTFGHVTLGNLAGIAAMIREERLLPLMRASIAAGVKHEAVAAEALKLVHASITQDELLDRIRQFDGAYILLNLSLKRHHPDKSLDDYVLTIDELNQLSDWVFAISGMLRRPNPSLLPPTAMTAEAGSSTGTTSSPG